MKQLYIYLYIFLTLICFGGCSDYFLKEEPVIKSTFEPVYIESQNGELQTLTLDLPEAGNAQFQIRQYPKWMRFQQMNGSFSGGKTAISFHILPGEFLNYGENSGDLIISIKGYGLAHIDIIVGKKNKPDETLIYIYPDILNFQSEMNELSFTMQNQSDNSVTWKATNYPEWIQLEKTEGSLQLYENVFIKTTCIRTNLTPGTHTGQITLEFNQPDGSTKTRHISVSVHVIEYTNPAGLIEIDGIVADAVYCKESDRLFIITRNPN